MAQYSTALNEDSYLSGKPDNRTGLFSKNISVGKISGNYHNGPHFSLKLGFNPLTSSSSSGSSLFGTGWGLSLPAYICDVEARPNLKGHLALLNGASYYTQPEDGTLALEGYLLKDMIVTCSLEPSLSFTVLHKSGAQEIYQTVDNDRSGNTFLSQMSDASGRSLYFNYQMGDEVRLNTITDDTGTELLQVIYNNAMPEITLYPNTVEALSFTLMIEKGNLTKIYGPEGYEADLQYIDFNNQRLISQVDDNQGVHETAYYTNEMTIPGGLNHQATIEYYTKVGDPNNPDSNYVATYGFNQGDSNYLGFPAVVTTEESIDSLLHVKEPFSYTTSFTENIGGLSQDVKTTTCTYNKFHSLVEKKITYGESGHILTETYAYPVDNNTDISGQKPTYKLQTGVTKTWLYGEESRSETTLAQWDDFGNPTSITKKSGILTSIEYYPAEGETGCPADINGFISRRKVKTVTPAAIADATLPVAPIRQTLYTYNSLPLYSTVETMGRFILRTQKSEQELLSSGESLVHHVQNYTYINSAADLLSHGKIQTAERIIYHAENDQNKPYSTLLTLNYELLPTKDGAPLQKRLTLLTTGYDASNKTSRVDRSYLTGRIYATAEISTQGVDPTITTDFTYDGLGRISSKISCQGTAFAAWQSFTYQNGDIDALSENYSYPCKTTINANGVGSRTYTDGERHTLYQEQQDSDGVVSSDTGKYYRTSETVYNALGQRISQSSYDFYAGWTPIATTTTYDYDYWGNQSAITYPDGHQESSTNNPLTLTTEHAVIVSGKQEQWQISQNDVFGNTLSTTSFHVDGTVYATQSSDYDGLGRRVKKTDALLNVSLTEYDFFDRPIANTRPDGSVLLIDYAPHTTKSLITGINMVESQDDNADRYTFGTRTYDGLNRITQNLIGERISTYDYPVGSFSPKPETVTAPNGNVFFYTYQPELNYGITGVLSSAVTDPTLAYEYDSLTAAVKQASSDISSVGDHNVWTYDYFLSGNVKEQTLNYTLSSGETATRTDSYCYSLGGLMVTHIDVQGQTHSLSYNNLGQNTGYQLLESQVSANYYFDGAGRLVKSLTQAPDGNTQITEMTFDEFGREETRTLTVKNLAGQTLGIQQQVLVYTVDNNISSRTWYRDEQLLRAETYTYTPLNQMDTYRCEGDAFPDAPNDYRLAQQSYTFTFLGNINSVISDVIAVDGSSIRNTATYTYADKDREQLKSITNDKIIDWDTTLVYDLNGNVIQDEEGNTLAYNGFNQLVTISESTETLVGNYWYDANGILLAEKKTIDDAATLMFYQFGQLVNEMKGDQVSTYLETLSRVLLDTSSDDMSVQLLGSDQQGSIVQMNQGDEIAYRIYDPYGYSKED